MTVGIISSVLLQCKLALFVDKIAHAVQLMLNYKTLLFGKHSQKYICFGPVI